MSAKRQCLCGGVNKNNGKSTLMNLMKLILNEYCKSVSKCVFIKSKSDSKLTPEREALKDTRRAIFSESGADDALNDEVLKMASGDDPIRVNPKYQAEYEFTSYAKLVMATNHKPKIDVSDEALVRRLKFNPFLAKFVPNPVAENERYRDVQLVMRMKTELLDAFFTWALDGSIEWYQHGMVDIPAVMQEATAVFIGENDEIGEFINESMDVDPDGEILSSAMFSMYVSWCRTRGSEPKKLRAFSTEVAKRYAKAHTRKGNVYKGIRTRVYGTEDDLGI
eukprot:TRINITY_DN427_c0_g1_i16.p1 TRINITY_DN427_c0_g1~~TRINITY_DN427_c0_g1_i16.p1  ORF type:complete len:279 (-),score=44.32 TRINITY_DN427_c0_g1_i16:441-1277(-)